MLTRFQAIFSIVGGLSICGIWTMLLATDSVADLEAKPVLITTHIVSEFLTAAFLLVGGVALLRKKPFALRVFLVGQGLLMYSALNAGAYYADTGGMQAVFISIFALSALLLILTFAKSPGA